jgi:two-component system LytT family response regulator
MKPIRVFVVEDEHLARASLRELIDETEGLTLAGEAADGLSAVTEIDRVLPDLLFLDVILPELTGLEVLDRIRHRPLVVFTTAYERYAVTAFELEALDYIVKPFGRQRFHDTVERVRRRLDEGALPPSSDQLRAAFGTAPLERLFSRVGSRIVPLAIRDVTRFQGEGDYVRAHSPAGAHLLHVTLAELEERLALPFLRVHRSHIVNVDRIERIERHDERRLIVFLGDGSRIVASRTGSARLRELTR